MWPSRSTSSNWKALAIILFITAGLSTGRTIGDRKPMMGRSPRPEGPEVDPNQKPRLYCITCPSIQLYDIDFEVPDKILDRIRQEQANYFNPGPGEEDSAEDQAPNEDEGGFGSDEQLPNRLYGFENCNPAQKRRIVEGFQDAASIINPGSDGRKPEDPYTINWTDAEAIEFFGPASKTFKYRARVAKNLKDISRYLRLDLPFREMLKVGCHREGDDCKPSSYALTYVVGEYHQAPNYMIFCPKFFNSLPSWGEVLAKHKSQPGKLPATNLGDWKTTAWTVIHELFHLPYNAKMHPDAWSYYPEPTRCLQDIIVPGRDVACYGSQCGRLVSYGQFTKIPGWVASSNADNYVCYVVAKYVRERIGFYTWEIDIAREPWPYPNRESDIEMEVESKTGEYGPDDIGHYPNFKHKYPEDED